MGSERWIRSQPRLHKLAMLLALLALFSLSKKKPCSLGVVMTWRDFTQTAEKTYL
jgi:hypothetical protein